MITVTSAVVSSASVGTPGTSADGVALVDPARPAAKQPRDVFTYVIHEGKVRAPAAAMELIRLIG